MQNASIYPIHFIFSIHVKLKQVFFIDAKMEVTSDILLSCMHDKPFSEGKFYFSFAKIRTH